MSINSCSSWFVFFVLVRLLVNLILSSIHLCVFDDKCL